MIFTFVDAILEILTGDDHIYPSPFEKPYKMVKRIRKWEREKYYKTVWQMQKRGIVQIFEENGKKFIQCTKKGQLETIFKKASHPRKKTWDGNWRLISYDIPEKSNSKRNQFRYLLKRNKFLKLQASLFISPFELNREAIAYLKETGLIQFIRIMKVSEMDDDRDLRKKFKL